MSSKPDRVAWLKGGDAECVRMPTVLRPTRLVLMGAPGVGKGTQADLLSKRLGACQLSTGDVFRAKSLDPCDRSPEMTAAVEIVRQGGLIPDETVLNMVRERVGCLRCQGGFLLDGFPRTVVQAEALQDILDREGLRLNAVLSYELPLEQIVSRLGGRRTCPRCKSVFHVQARPPKKPEVCDHCGESLIQRDDDRPEAIRVRMDAYQASTAPLADYYRRKDLLVSIAANGTPEEIVERSLAVLNARMSTGR